MNSIINSEADSVFASSILRSILKQLRSQVSSAVWNHCHAAQNNEDLKFKYYTYYMISEIYFINISINMQKYLWEWHDIEVDIAVSQVQAAIFQQLKQLYLWAELSDQIKVINA